MSEIKTETQEMLNSIIEGILEKGGKDIVSLDMRHINNSVCEYFVISHGDSNTQVDAIANSVQDKVRENLNEKVWHKEGMNNSTWVLLDYSNIIVHIFQKEHRDFYNLEELWGDAKITKIEDK
ncbi:MAG: ribosome silencing factor [Bacteroidales bacterium]|jgi:ribosome-associated protein|nr:ribosome silencing factor [Bacteroidales bacterium]